MPATAFGTIWTFYTPSCTATRMTGTSRLKHPSPSLRSCRVRVPCELAPSTHWPERPRMMSTSPPESYADWKAPPQDGASLIWPEPTSLLRETHENQRRLSSADAVLVQNIPLSKLRRLARESIGHDPA